MNNSELISAALEARERSYCPYSGFAVGAALECADGSIYLGCNIENSAFGPTVCAERTAFFKAVSDGKTDFAKIAVVGGKAGEVPCDYCPPCGVCRQVMQEFCKPDFEILIAKNADEYKSLTLAEILPLGFSKPEV